MYFLEGRGVMDTRKYLQSPQAFHHVLIKHRTEESSKGGEGSQLCLNKKLFHFFPLDSRKCLQSPQGFHVLIKHEIGREVNLHKAWTISFLGGWGGVEHKMHESRKKMFQEFKKFKPFWGYFPLKNGVLTGQNASPYPKICCRKPKISTLAERTWYG